MRYMTQVPVDPGEGVSSRRAIRAFAPGRGLPRRRTSGGGGETSGISFAGLEEACPMAKAVAHEVQTVAGRIPAPDGAELFWREWFTEGKARTAILFLHGAGEHSGRYEAFGRYFAERGIPVLAYDHRGLGQSGGPRGHVDRFEDFVRDAMLFRGLIAERHGGAKVVLVGHSMGGLIALATAERHGDAFAAVAVSGPALRLTLEVPGWKSALGKFLANVTPKFTMTNEIDPAVLARNPEVGRRYAADPNICRLVSARFYVEMLRGMQETNAGAGSLKTPAFILHGSADKLTSLEGSRSFYERLGDIPKAFRVMDGFYHELFQEDEREEVFRLIEEWLGGVV